MQDTTENRSKNQNPPHQIDFTVDGEPYETTDKEMTPDAILKLVGRDPTSSYLVQIQGDHQVSYQGKGSEPIKLHKNIKFQVISTGPTPVSDPVNNMTGVARFAAELTALGYKVEALLSKPDHIYFEYIVPCGKHKGRTLLIGLIVPNDFPATAPGGPHISEAIHPINTDGEHPTGRVHKSQAEPYQTALSGDWQYWSRPFLEWGKTKKTVAGYLSHIWRLWESQ